MMLRCFLNRLASSTSVSLGLRRVLTTTTTTTTTITNDNPSSSSSSSSSSACAAVLATIDLSVLGSEPVVHSKEWNETVRAVSSVFEERKASSASAEAGRRGKGEESFTCFYANLSSLVPSASIAKGYENLQAFHSLEDSVKAKYHSNKSRISRGWVPLFEEPAYEEKVSFVEAFDLGIEMSEAEARGEPGIGPNVWPCKELPLFEKEVYQLYEDLSRASSVLFKLLACALELPPDEFEKHATKRARSVMRLLRYPPKEGLEEREGEREGEGEAVGISAHTDFECFTLIHQSACGLQVLGSNGKWYEIPPPPAQLAAQPSNSSSIFVVLIGDMLECWTNGKVKATPHRVVRPKEERMSLIRFNGLDNETRVTPHSKFISPENPLQDRYADGLVQGHHLQRAAENAQKNTENLLRKGKLKKSPYYDQEGSIKTL